MTYRASQRIGYPGVIVRARASVDPRGAVAMIEALPPARFDRRDGIMNQAREELVTCLVEPIEEHWKFIWRRSDIDLDEPRFR
jgi:hypothetical protein